MQWVQNEEDRALLSTHGYSTNSITVHTYPRLETMIEVQDAHASRVLWSALGPAGDVVCTGASGREIKFWRIWGKL
jgi:cell division cycle protein 20 (cofactor of APC complex)